MKFAVFRPDASAGASLRRAATRDLEAVGAHWACFGDRLLVHCANAEWSDSAARAARSGLERVGEVGDVAPHTLRLVIQKGRLFQRAYPGVPVVLDAGRYLAVEVGAEEAREFEQGETCGYRILPLPKGDVVFEIRRGAGRRASRAVRVGRSVEAVSPEHYDAALAHLAGFPDRHSAGASFAAAASWCLDQLVALDYDVHLQAVELDDGGETANVVAERAAGAADAGLVLVTAHLDSVNLAGGADAPAPGADDNASGSAGLLEIARVFAGRELRHGLRLVLFGGEEQGLFGSRAHVAALAPGEAERIRAVVNMDMIGSLNAARPAVLLEGAPLSQQVIDDLARAAEDATSLEVQTSLHPFASDHVPFLDAGIPAVLTIEGTDSANEAIHTADDTLDRIHAPLAHDIVRMNVGFLAHLLGAEGEVPMPQPSRSLASAPDPILSLDGETRAALLAILGRGAVQYSGRYVLGTPPAPRSRERATDANPLMGRSAPVPADEPPSGAGDGVHLFLHVDVDGVDPLQVVSGEVTQAPIVPSAHFIGRVTHADWSAGAVDLVVEDFRFRWPGASDDIDRLEIHLVGSALQTPRADVTFVDTARDKRRGPFSVERRSPFFREVEIEVDTEDEALAVEPYDTHAHPDRPLDLPREQITIETAFAKAGVQVVRSSESNVIDTSEAGPDRRWTEAEMHDAMELHWSAFANRPQWKMWLFVGELGDSDELGGIMFDGEIDEPGGVDRQGTAIFTRAPFFHDEAGAYPQANPPAREAALRELFFNTIHESGHAFNLAHSFQKQSVFGPGDAAWTPPAWMPLLSNPRALSWMNYPDSPSPGLSASWFYERFRFRFDDGENLFLRHAPAEFVRMGDAAWFHDHGRVARSALDRRLELVARSRRRDVELGEPVFVELRLTNRSHEDLLVDPRLEIGGTVGVSITDPSGRRRPFVPVATRCEHGSTVVLRPGERIYQAFQLGVGRYGCPFKTPGHHTVEVSYRNATGGGAAAILQLYVRTAANSDEERAVAELFHARVARAVQFGGSRVMEEENDKIDWVCARLGDAHPARVALRTARALPLARRYKVLSAHDKRVDVRDPDPDRVVETLEPVVDDPARSADVVGHIPFRGVVETYARCAVAVGDRQRARESLEALAGTYRTRGVPDAVVEQVEGTARRIG